MATDQLIDLNELITNDLVELSSPRPWLPPTPRPKALTIIGYKTGPENEVQAGCFRSWMETMASRDPSTKYEVVVRRVDSLKEQGRKVPFSYGSPAFNSIFRLRIEDLRNLARRRHGQGRTDEPIMLVGFDVVPLEPFSRLFTTLDHNDLVLAHEPRGSGSGYVNGDFYFFRPTSRVLHFFDDVVQSMNRTDGRFWSDQHVINRLLWGWKSETEIADQGNAGSTLPSIPRSIRPSLRWGVLRESIVTGFYPHSIKKGTTVAYHANGPGMPKDEKIYRAVRGGEGRTFLGAHACVWNDSSTWPPAVSPPPAPAASKPSLKPSLMRSPDEVGQLRDEVSALRASLDKLRNEIRQNHQPRVAFVK